MIENAYTSNDFLSFLYFSWDLRCIARVANYDRSLSDSLSISDSDDLTVVPVDKLVEFLIEDVGAPMNGAHSNEIYS